MGSTASEYGSRAPTGFSDTYLKPSGIFHVSPSSRKHPIGAPLRHALDAMLEMLEIDRRNAPWPELRRLNYGAYWKSQYGYENDADSGDVVS